MTISYSEIAVNLAKMPVIGADIDPHRTDVTIGDLHANTLRFIHFLVRFGICEWTADPFGISAQESYEILYNAYQLCDFTSPDFLDQDLSEGHYLNAILDFKMTFWRCLRVIDTTTKLRLIGDELGDRGKNDILTLWLIDYLNEHNVRFEIIFSNHAAFFFQEYCYINTANRDRSHSNIPPEQVRSLESLITTMEMNLVSKYEVIDLIERAYKPNLKLISYGLDVDGSGITIYSHAPIDIAVIEIAAERYQILFDNSTPTTLAQVIDEVNAAFLDEFNNPTFILTYMCGFSSWLKPNVYSVINFMVWNRNYDLIDRQSNYNGYQVRYVHGHDYHRPTQQSCGIYNLDSLLGKTVAGSSCDEADEPITTSDELSYKQLMTAPLPQTFFRPAGASAQSRFSEWFVQEGLTNP